MKYPQKIDSFDILGVRINSLTRILTIEVIEYWIKHNIRDYIVLTGVHGMTLLKIVDTPNSLVV